MKIPLAIPLLLLILLTGPPKALASRIKIPDADLCVASTWVFIGTTVARENHIVPSGTYGKGEDGPPVYTAITVAVETVIHGSPPPEVVIGVPGGRLADGTSVTYFMGPEVKPGLRHLILASPNGPAVPKGGTSLHEFREINADTRLPPESTLQAIWAEHCDPTSALRPKIPYLDLVPHLMDAVDFAAQPNRESPP